MTRHYSMRPSTLRRAAGPHCIAVCRPLSFARVRRIHVDRRISAYGLLAFRSLIVVMCVLFVGLPQLLSAFQASERYATTTESDWEGTNNSLESAKCARKTGKW